MPKWRLKSGSSRPIVGGRRYDLNPGDEIECEEYVLRNFLDQYERLDSKLPTEEKRPEADLEVVQRKGNTGRLIPWYDVVNRATGKPINTRALKKAEAKELMR